MLTKEIAQEIVKETMTRLHKNINIMDKHGKILASGDLSRIDQIHEGALYVIQNHQPLIIDHPTEWRGALPGINLPIVFDGKFVGVIGITGDPVDIQPIGELVKMITEMMIRQSFISSQIEWKQQIKELVFHELVQSSPNVESIEQRLNLLEVKLHPPYQVVLIEIIEKTLPKSSLIKMITDEIHDDCMFTGFFDVQRLFFLAQELTEEKILRKIHSIARLLKQMGIRFRVGLGSEVSVMEQIHFSFQEAQLALQFGMKNQSLVSYSDVEMKVLLSQIGEKYRSKFSSRILTPLSGKDIETLQSFFACDLNLSEAAKELFIHRNTLMYRLNKIKEVTGYDPHNFHDAVTLQMALWMRE